MDAIAVVGEFCTGLLLVEHQKQQQGRWMVGQQQQQQWKHVWLSGGCSAAMEAVVVVGGYCTLMDTLVLVGGYANRGHNSAVWWLVYRWTQLCWAVTVQHQWTQ